MWLSLDCSDKAQDNNTHVEMCPMGIGRTKFCESTSGHKINDITHLATGDFALYFIGSEFTSKPSRNPSLKCLHWKRHPPTRIGVFRRAHCCRGRGKFFTRASLANLHLKVDQSPEFVDTEAKFATLVGRLQNLPTKPPSLYIDVEGVNLSRHGSISILQIYVLPLEETYLVDIHSLQKKAFLQTASDKGQTLLGILESPHIPKVFFEVRNDSDALFHHFNVKLSGVIDLQLMELAIRYYSRKYVSGLAKCIERDACLTTYEIRCWKASKEKGLKLFAPEHGGSYDVFKVHPLLDDIKKYCVQDVRFLPRLWAQYHRKISPSWASKVTTETINRIMRSQTATYDGRGRWKALAPAGWY